jgi:hypothetical protein
MHDMYGSCTQLCGAYDCCKYTPVCSLFLDRELTCLQQRWWLGVAEAGLFPGVNYYLS